MDVIRKLKQHAINELTVGRVERWRTRCRQWS